MAMCKLPPGTGVGPHLLLGTVPRHIWEQTRWKAWTNTMPETCHPAQQCRESSSTTHSLIWRQPTWWAWRIACQFSLVYRHIFLVLPSDHIAGRQKWKVMREGACTFSASDTLHVSCPGLEVTLPISAVPCAWIFGLLLKHLLYFINCACN